MGMLVFFDTVRHPGMQGTRYLTTPLRVIGRAQGFRVVLLERPG